MTATLFTTEAAVETPWWERRLCGLDLETTDKDPEAARVVSCAIALAGGGAETWSHTWKVNPGVPIPVEASAVHGILDEDVAGAPSFCELMPDVMAVLEEVREERLALAVFNGRYDLTVLDRELRRCGEEFQWGGIYVIDPLVIDKQLWTYRAGSRKLEWMARVWNAELERERDGEHEAAHDALAAARLAWRMGRNGFVREERNRQARAAKQQEWEQVRGDLVALHEAQRRWAAWQAEDLERWFAKNGAPERVAREWPVLPVGAGGS